MATSNGNLGICESAYRKEESRTIQELASSYVSTTVL